MSDKTTLFQSSHSSYGTDPGSICLHNSEDPLTASENCCESNIMNLGQRTKNFKLVMAASAGLLLLCAAVSVGVVYESKTTDGSPNVNRENVETKDGTFSFEDFINNRFTAKYFNGSWWSENEIQWSDKDGNLVAWNVETGENDIIVSKEMLSSVSDGTKFMGFSPDNSMILFAFDIASVWRHSFTARYLVLDTSTNQTTTILAPNGNDQLQYCDWVFNDEDENTLIIVSENNIYWKPDAVKQDIIVITADGLVDNVFNGIPDWVYEEEVLSTNYAHYISQSGYKVVFAQFNDTLVPEFKYPNYGNPYDVLNAQYPTYKTVRYPKSGETNPTIKLYVRQVSEDNNKAVVPPEEVQDWEEYIYTDVTWVNENTVSVIWMNRIQNQGVFSICKEGSDNWNCNTIYRIEQQNGWLSPSTKPMWFNEDGSEFLTILSVETDENTQVNTIATRNYPNIAKIDMNSNVVHLSKGVFVVTEILSWDETNGVVYFMGTAENGPGKRHMYKVLENGDSLECVTCELMGLNGKVCDYSDVDINSDNTYFVHTCLGKDVPEVTVRSLSDGSIIQTIEDNKALIERLESKIIPPRLDTTVAVDGNFAAPVKLILPPNKVEGEKYPLVVKVYGGPGSQLVDYRWGLTWEHYLAGSEDIVIAIIDGRGTGLQSDEYMFTVYRNLGTVEMIDQIAVTQKLIETYDFIDGGRVGIWGWSYGGFATAMTLERDSGPNPVFACGISVAPPTSWLLYDSIYTERFMALPIDNFDGYNNSVINGIENLRGKKWMLNHGVADDNVHYQHTMLLTSAMERADIQFEQHSYPDENHRLGRVQRFLYHAMDDFWGRCFGRSEK